MKDTRSRFYEIILYKDFPDYEDFINYLNNNYEIIYILHDKDWYNEDTEDHIKGELKKEHFHILFRFENARYKSAFSKEIDYFDNLITPVSNYKKFLLYMIHFKDKYKYNYSIEELKGSQNLIDITRDLLDKERGEGETIADILDYINDQDWYVDQENVIKYCLSSNYWSVFRRNYIIIRNYLLNHNKKINDKLNMKESKINEKEII